MLLAAGAYAEGGESDLQLWDLALVQLDTPLGLTAGWLGVLPTCEISSTAESTESSSSRISSASNRDQATSQGSSSSSSSMPLPAAAPATQGITLQTIGYPAVFHDSSSTCAYTQCSVAFDPSNASTSSPELITGADGASTVINTCDRQLLYHTCDAEKGQSGSPMLQQLLLGQGNGSQLATGPFVQAVLTGQVCELA